MSKFFNETQKASQWAQKQPAKQDLDIRQTLENLKQGTSSASNEVASVRLNQCGKINIVTANRNAAALALLHEDSAQIALEAYRGLRTRLMRIQEKSGLRSVAISSSFPREGKTLTVMNLGLCYAQLADQRVLIVDGDLRTRGLTQLLGQPNTAGLGEVLAGRASPDKAILATNHENLFAVPAGSASSPPPELFTGPRWQEFLGWCSETFKIILVDTPPILSLADFELISAVCDGIVMIVRARHVNREILQKTASSLDSKKLLGVIFNGTDSNPKGYYEYGYGGGRRGSAS